MKYLIRLFFVVMCVPSLLLSCHKEHNNGKQNLAVISGSKIMSVTLGLGHSYLYSYDEAGRLSTMDVPNYHEYTFDYSNNEYISAYNKFFPVRIFPDSDGRVDYYEILELDGKKRFVKFEYSEEGLARKIECFRSNSIDGERENVFSQTFEHCNGVVTCSREWDNGESIFPIHNSNIVNNFNIPIASFAVPFWMEDVITPLAVFSRYLPEVIETTDSYNGEIITHKVMYGRNNKGDICSISVLGINIQINIEYYE